MISRFEGDKRPHIRRTAAFLLLALLSAGGIPWLRAQYGAGGLEYGLVVLVLFFAYGAVLYGRIAVSPFWIAVDETGVMVTAAGRSTTLRWDQVDSMGVELKPGPVHRPVPVLTATPASGHTVPTRRWGYPRWSEQLDAIVLFELEELKGAADRLVAACEGYAGERWRYDLPETGG
ncbi:hypothetical protein [Actinoallomurus sp. CA-142502]|uniref:hypothetical protein n=1 Tax=Actinoallomurus sp. CA-142502 TaxID=3239885 RepID=UPI003D89E607